MLPLLLALAFILELIAFASFSALALVFDISNPAKVTCVAVSFIALIIFWGLYMSPRATKKLVPIGHYLAQFVIYAISAFVIWRLVSGMAAMVFIGAALADELLLKKYNKGIAH